MAQQQRVIADWGGDEVFARTPRRRFKPSPVEATQTGQVLLEDPAPLRLVEPIENVYEPYFEPEVAANGRRTVTITGRPGLAAVPTVRPETTIRRRPPRTVEERVVARPDRVAGWAFGLGLTLILAAVATADAAPL